eukprot:2060059-Alexandrium_andersonii.AAC.1
MHHASRASPQLHGHCAPGTLNPCICAAKPLTPCRRPRERAHQHHTVRTRPPIAGKRNWLVDNAL